MNDLTLPDLVENGVDGLRPLGSQLPSVSVQDPFRYVATELVADVRERGADAGVTPRRILDRHFIRNEIRA